MTTSVIDSKSEVRKLCSVKETQSGAVIKKNGVQVYYLYVQTFFK